MHTAPSVIGWWRNLESTLIWNTKSFARFGLQNFQPTSLCKEAISIGTHSKWCAFKRRTLSLTQQRHQKTSNWKSLEISNFELKFVSLIVRGQIRHVSWWLIITPLSRILLSNRSFNGKLITLNGEWIFIKLGELSLVVGINLLKRLNPLSWEPCMQAADWILSNWLISSRMLSQHFACSIHPHQLVRISLVRIFRLCLLNCPPPKSNRTDHSHVGFPQHRCSNSEQFVLLAIFQINIKVFDRNY